MCLEEMLEVVVPEGALFYGRNRRRRTVTLDSGLRALTARVAADMRKMLAAREVPPAEFEPRKCNACSLKEVCQPQSPRGPNTVLRWLMRAIEG